MIINELEKKVTGSGTRIVFTEGWDPRVQEAAIKLVENNIVVPILLGEPEEIEACAKENGFDVSNIQQMSPKSFDKMEEMATKMVELRRGKLDMETCKKMLQHTNYFGTMLVQMGYADGLLGGATYSTADTVRPALQLVKTAPGNALVSSCFLLVKVISSTSWVTAQSTSIQMQMNWLKSQCRQLTQLNSLVSIQK